MSPQVARYTGLSPPLLPFIPSLKDPSPTISRNGRPFVRMIGKSIGKMIGWLVGQNRSDLGRKYNGEQDKYVSSAGRGGGKGDGKEATEISISPDEDPFPLQRSFSVFISQLV